MNTEAEPQNEIQTLTALDRCDVGCGARAAVKVTGLAGELLFCGHHYNKHEAKLNEWAFETLDERWALSNKTSSSAAF